MSFLVTLVSDNHSTQICVVQKNPGLRARKGFKGAVHVDCCCAWKFLPWWCHRFSDCLHSGEQKNSGSPGSTKNPGSSRSRAPGTSGQTDISYLILLFAILFPPLTTKWMHRHFRLDSRWKW